MGSRVNYYGLVIAGIGFFLTRFTVTLAAYETPLRFYLAGVVPLVLGLGLAAFGVALAIADVDRDVARSAAVWCVVGGGTMAVLVVLTLLGSTTGMPTVETLRSRTYLSNFLIGGSVGGTLTGLYAARTRRQRAELRHQTNRLEVLNRLLRHEVLNSLAVIKGFATIRSDETAATIERHTESIEETIEEVKYLTQSARTGERRGGVTALGACLTTSVETIRDRYPTADVSVDVPDGDVSVVANDRLEQVFVHLLENAVVYSTSTDPYVAVSVRTTPRSVRVSVRDDGPGLPESRRSLLETGEIERFDNPKMGYGLNVVRLLVESYRGSIETSVDDDGSTVTVVLSRPPTADGFQPTPTSLHSVRPALPHLVVTTAAALVAGVVYGLTAELLGGSVSVIGVFYGIENAVVGWITHEFHSVVFGFVFAGLVSLAPDRYRTSLPAYVAIGLAWGTVLWFVAAGIVSAVWLRLLGIPAPLPSLSVMILVSHLVWGVSLGVLTALGYQYATPWMARLGDRLRVLVPWSV